MILECEPKLEDALLRNGHPPEQAAVAADTSDKMANHRAGYEYITMRSNEDKAGLLVAVRATVGTQLDLLYWNLRNDGCYRGKGSKKRRQHIHDLWLSR